MANPDASRSFFGDVNRYLDAAAHHASLAEGVIRQVKACNAVYRIQFPVRDDTGEVQVVVGSRSAAEGADSMAMLADYDNVKHEYVFNSNIRELYYGHTNNMAVRQECFEEIARYWRVRLLWWKAVLRLTFRRHRKS